MYLRRLFAIASILAIIITLLLTVGARVTSTKASSGGLAFTTYKLAHIQATSTYQNGYSPLQIEGAYSLNGTYTGSGKTIAIVDAYDDPTATNDFDVFSSQWGLPTIAGGCNCFTKVDQTGGTNYPRTNSGWALEISLDIEWAHAIAPQAHILLVEANSNSFANLLAAERGIANAVFRQADVRIDVRQLLGRSQAHVDPKIPLQGHVCFQTGPVALVHHDDHSRTGEHRRPADNVVKVFEHAESFLGHTGG